jgi:amino acid transporter
MFISALVISLSYVLPLAALAAAHYSTANFTTGAWTTAAASIGGSALGWWVAAGGVLTGIGMFNALVMSYSRLPMVMAEDGLLPRFLARRNARGVPWVSVIACSAAWALALNLSFERLITIDLVLYGAGLLLEFVALVILRIREPKLIRPFRAGSFPMACALGIFPALLIGYALWISRTDVVSLGSTQIPALLFSSAIALLGPILYLLSRKLWA